MRAAPERRRARLRAWALLALAAAAWPCLAAGTLWDGTIGTQPVVVDLDVSTAHAAGRYFYRRHLLSIPLQVVRGAHGEIEATEHADWRATHQPQWRVKPAAGGRLEGEWVGVDGQRLPVRLHRRAAPAAAADAALEPLRHDDPYRYLQLAALTLRPLLTQQVGGYALQWFIEPRTGARLFQLRAGYTPLQRQRLNRVLRERHWQLVGDALDCLAGPGADFEATTTLRRISARVLSVSVFTSYYCGGAHPDFGDGPLNLDPATGAELSLDDVLQVQPGPTPATSAAARTATPDDAGTEARGAWLAARMAARHPRRMKPDGDDGCDYTQPALWQDPSWHVRAEGLYIGPVFPRVARACEYPEWSVLPWADVDAHHGRVRVH